MRRRKLARIVNEFIEKHSQLIGDDAYLDPHPHQITMFEVVSDLLKDLGFEFIPQGMGEMALYDKKVGTYLDAGVSL